MGAAVLRSHAWHRRVTAAIALLFLTSPLVARSDRPNLETLNDLLGEGTRRSTALRRLADAPVPELVAPLIDTLFFIPKTERGAVLAVLRAWTKEDAGTRYLDWVDLVMRHPEWQAPAGYAAWKATLFARIDPCFGPLLRAEPVHLRAEEIVFGGVGCEGISALDSPAHVEAGEASWLADDALVFGATVGGASRAYSESVLSWHEMLNDDLGGEPVTLSYCTLCRSALLYSGVVDGQRLKFGTSGLLYRSNKLMLDRATRSLWHNLTGEAVVGPMAARKARLRALPLTLTTWLEWRTRNPSTTVLRPDPAQARALGYDYRPGAADARRAGVRFPTGQPGPALAEGTEIYGLRATDEAKAYPLDTLLRLGLVNDSVGGMPVVLLADRVSGSVRAFHRGAEIFNLGGDGRPATGDTSWTVEETRLVNSAGETRERFPGTLAVWRGWFAFFPRSAIYRPEP